MQSNVQAKSLLESAQRYAQSLSVEAVQYLEGRGISKDIAQQFMLGIITDAAPGHEMHEGWLSIPYITALGHCVGYKFRRLDDGKPKYGSPQGQKSHLYNVSDITLDTHSIVVCEGELDAIILSGMCKIPAVGVPGVTAWKPHFTKLFTGFDTVYIVGDNDVKEDGSNPGADFARRVAGELINGQIVSLPPNMDINDLYLTEGPEALTHLLGGVQ